MKANFNDLPILEDLVGAKMPLSEAMAFLAHMRDEKWSPLRAWAFLLKKETDGFSKFDLNEVSVHIKSKVGDKPLAEVGR